MKSRKQLLDNTEDSESKSPTEIVETVEAVTQPVETLDTQPAETVVTNPLEATTRSVETPVSYSHLKLPTIYSV